jgi:hypothetical protein
MNMNHCRFTNGLKDLEDCEKHIDDELSEEEERVREKLILSCVDMAIKYGHWYNRDIIDVEEKAIVLFEK